MKKQSISNSSKKDTPIKQENGISNTHALRATKRAVFPHKISENKADTATTVRVNPSALIKEQGHPLTSKEKALYQSIKSLPNSLKRKLMCDEEAQKLLFQYEAGKKENMSRDETIELYRSLLPKLPSIKESHILQKKEAQMDSSLTLEGSSNTKKSYLRNGMIYRYDQNLTETEFISIGDSSNCIHSREGDPELSENSANQAEGTRKIETKESSLENKPENLYQSHMYRGLIYHPAQHHHEAEFLSQRPTDHEFILRDAPGPWKMKANRTIGIDLPNSQGKILVKLIASKKLGSGGFGVAKKIIVEHPDGSQKKMVVKAIKHRLDSDFKFIEREGELLENVGLLIGTRVDSSQHKFFMPYLGKKLSRYLTNDHPGNMQFNLSLEERQAVIHGLLESLAKIHGRKIIHSDVGIHNLGLKKYPLSAALFDFNLSIKEGEQRGNAGVPLTAAPEILSGVTNNYATDIYSAGITIALILEITSYKLLTLPNTPPAPVAFLAPKEDTTFGEGGYHEGAITKMQRKYGYTAEQAEGIYSILDKMTNNDPALRPSAAELCTAFKLLLAAPNVTRDLSCNP
jgi:tRNA A-37 threonylcarbamoyl transferase component Bud32